MMIPPSRHDSGRREPPVDPQVEAVLPTVKDVLDDLVMFNRVRKAVVNKGPLGPKVFYAPAEEPRR